MADSEGVVVPTGDYTDIHIRPTRYEVSVLPRDFPDGDMWTITVEYRGKGLWGVFKTGKQCLGADGEWDWESLPSGREDDWLETHRFPLDKALALAEGIAPKMLVGTRFGMMSAYDAIAQQKKWDEDGGK